MAPFSSPKAARAPSHDFKIRCRGDTRPARGSKLTLLSKRRIDGYHPSKKFASNEGLSKRRGRITWALQRETSCLRCALAWRCGPVGHGQLSSFAAAPRTRQRATQRLRLATYSDQSPSRAPRATTRGALFSCFAAARAACVSTWLGESGNCARTGGTCACYTAHKLTMRSKATLTTQKFRESPVKSLLLGLKRWHIFATFPVTLHLQRGYKADRNIEHGRMAHLFSEFRRNSAEVTLCLTSRPTDPDSVWQVSLQNAENTIKKLSLASSKIY